ncbi:MAG: hypothetical protein HKN90_00515 [Flavobacteriaceae bacterium]|nr:hypothetical protein [Flavobacteriaceae bacterium]
MKRLKLITAIVALMISSLSFANVNEEPTDKELRKKIIQILGNSTDKVADGTITAQILFTFNDKSEIVVLSVDTDNQRVEWLVKSKLNYKKIKLDALNVGKLYKMPLKIVNK